MHIDFRGWISDFERTWETENKYKAVMGAMQDLHNGLFFSITSRYPIGSNVFELDWDLLLVLDACRVDAMEEVAPEYEFIDTVDSIWSVGSSSHEWTCKTYTKDHLDTIQDTALISTNPWVVRALREQRYPPDSYSVPLMWADWNVVVEDDFEEFWHIGEHDYEEYNLPASPDFMNNRVIKVGREFDFERTIVHYMQPHIPHGSAAYENNRPPTEIEAKPWKSIQSGNVTKEDVWENYLDNLRMVLDSIEMLIQNFDAETVVITADHGDLMGECGAYGHPAGFIHPAVKRVPWVKTNAKDTRTVFPDVDIRTQRSDVAVEEQLRTLGYMA